MQKLGGLLLIAAGVSLGAYTFLPNPFETDRPLREVTRISAAPDRAPESGRATWLVAEGPAQGASGHGTVRDATPAASTVPGTVEGTKPKAEADDSIGARSAATWSAIVMAEPGEPPRLSSAKPADLETRDQLTRDLQRELARVGCYGGEISGTWSPATRRAMGQFMERVNATLPIEEPDYILLTLVQGHAAMACGSACPSGQAADDRGRCVPTGIIAARNAKKTKAIATAQAPAAQAPAPQDDTARWSKRTVTVAMTEPTTKTPAQPAGRATAPAKGEDGPTERIAAAGGTERLPWLDKDDLSGAAVAPAPRVHRPDGMMAVGAVRPDDVPVASPRDVSVAALSDDPQAAQQAYRPKRTRKVTIKPPVQAVLQATDEELPASSSAIKPLKPKLAKKTKANIVQRPSPVLKPTKPKLFAAPAPSARRGMPRPGSPAFNMLQAMGGVF